MRKLNHILSFDDFRLTEWKKIEIDRDTKTHDMSIVIDGKEDDVEKNEMIMDLKSMLSDDYSMVKRLTGEYCGANFRKSIKDNIEIIRDIKDTGEKFDLDSSHVKFEGSVDYLKKNKYRFRHCSGRFKTYR